MTMLAQIWIEPQAAERRRSERRPMRLPSEGTAAESAVNAIVRNLSETGLLIEAGVGLTANDAVTVTLPIVGEVAAKVVWTRAPFYGCEFERPVPRAAVSAALLRSPIDEPAIELFGPADLTWQMSEAKFSPPRRVSGSALALLMVLGSAIALLIAAIAILPI